MKSLILISVVLGVTLAAPTKNEEVFGPKREKKSASYGPPAGPYGPGAASAPVSVYGSLAPASCGYAQAPAASPIAFYLAPGSHMPSALHYRAENEHPWESMMFSDHEDHPQARSYGGLYGPAAGAITGGAASTTASGPALGLFPNANIGGCAVPLLVSCAPSISQGQVLKSQHSAYSSPSYGYRNVDFDPQMRLREDAFQKMAEEQSQWSEMERAAAAAGMGHMHQPTFANSHHVNHMHPLSHDAQASHLNKLQGLHV